MTKLQYTNIAIIVGSAYSRLSWSPHRRHRRRRHSVAPRGKCKTLGCARHVACTMDIFPWWNISDIPAISRCIRASWYVFRNLRTLAEKSRVPPQARMYVHPRDVQPLTNVCDKAALLTPVANPRHARSDLKILHDYTGKKKCETRRNYGGISPSVANTFGNVPVKIHRVIYRRRLTESYLSAVLFIVPTFRLMAQLVCSSKAAYI